ncbi:hypothetical protein BJY00DRAFT_275218 [Aspergillus carlsbadensis]|nr:hypothetical protein BJY00DRAFT_275218 [Aspergillus carlsbadensis]
MEHSNSFILCIVPLLTLRVSNCILSLAAWQLSIIEYCTNVGTQKYLRFLTVFMHKSILNPRSIRDPTNQIRFPPARVPSSCSVLQPRLQLRRGKFRQNHHD